jgi:hypothetical protein
MSDSVQTSALPDGHKRFAVGPFLVAMIVSTASLVAAGHYARTTLHATGSMRPILIIVGLLFLYTVGGFLLSLLPGKRSWALGLWIGVAMAAVISAAFIAIHA